MTTMKTALITGATDGIGKEAALELARKGYSIHVLGRNQERGNAVLKTVQRIFPAGQHEVFFLDLADIAATKEFLANYRSRYGQLDLLVLNANAASKTLSLTAEGIEKNFAVGFVSRVLFSVQLDSLLRNTAGSRVLHIGDGRYAVDVPLGKLTATGHGVLRALAITYAADAHFVYQWHQQQLSPVPHELYYPGVVNTRQVKDLGWVLRNLAYLTGVIEPEDAGKAIVQHLMATKPQDAAGKLFNIGRERLFHRRIRGGAETFERVMAFVAEHAGLSPLVQLKVARSAS